MLRDQAPTLGSRAPLNTALLPETGPSQVTDLSAIWTLPAEPGRPQVAFAVRRLDDKGRLSVPLILSRPGKISVPAERTGAVLTLHLPGADRHPEPGRTVAALPLDHRGRLAVASAVRTELGWTPGCDVLVTHDPDQALLHLCAAWAVEHRLAAVLDELRESGPVPADASRPNSDQSGGAGLHSPARARPSTSSCHPDDISPTEELR